MSVPEVYKSKNDAITRRPSPANRPVFYIYNLFQIDAVHGDGNLVLHRSVVAKMNVNVPRSRGSGLLEESTMINALAGLKAGGKLTTDHRGNYRMTETDKALRRRTGTINSIQLHDEMAYSHGPESFKRKPKEEN